MIIAARAPQKAALDGHEQPARSSQRIRHREVDPRPAVDQDEVVLVEAVRREHVEQHVLPPLPGDGLLDHRLERERRRNQVDALEARGAAHAVERAGALRECSVSDSAGRIIWEATRVSDAAGRCRLRAHACPCARRSQRG